MKLLLKHIIRSIGKKPLQPLVIILTLALAMATSIFAFTIADTLEAEVDTTQTEKYGKSKFIISVGNTSDSRFLFADDVLDVIGEDVLAVGCYELPLILKGTGSTTMAVATEFEKFDDLFEVEFLEYGKVTRGTVADTAFVSSHFAQENDLSIGDTLEVEAMGYSQSYRIQGIADRPFLATYDVMVDISGLVRAFASNSLLFAAIGEDFKPCSKVYVNTDPAEQFEDTTDAISYLKQDPRFADKIFDELNNAERRAINIPVLELIIKFAVALAALLSGVVVFCCFYILANERTEENQALSYSGAGPKLLCIMQYTEVLLYWGIGALLGFLAAIPTSKLIVYFVSLQYVVPSITPASVLKSAFILFAVCALTTTIFIVLSRRIRRAGATHTTVPAKWIVWLLIVIGVLFVLMYLLPADPRLTVFVFAIAVIVALVFCATPFLIERIAWAVEKRIRAKQKPFVIAFRYAFKNVCSLKLLHNIARLCALIVMIILTLSLVFACVCAQIKNLGHVFDADYAVFNATDSCYQKATTCQSAKRVYRAYWTQTDWGMVVSADDLSVYADWMQIDRLPTGNEAVIGIGVSHAHSLKVGDTFELEGDGTEYEFVVSQIILTHSAYIAINCADMNIPYNMLLVQGKEGISSAELLGDLSQVTASELAPIAEADSLLERFIDAIRMYMDAGRILLLVFIAFSLIGMIDVFYESLRSRREEFRLYRIAGMTQRELRMMKISELGVAMLFGSMIGLGAFIISALVTNRGLSARGMELILGVLSFFD